VRSGSRGPSGAAKQKNIVLMGGVGRPMGDGGKEMQASYYYRGVRGTTRVKELNKNWDNLRRDIPSGWVASSQKPTKPRAIPSIPKCSRKKKGGAPGRRN